MIQGLGDEVEGLEQSAQRTPGRYSRIDMHVPSLFIA